MACSPISHQSHISCPTKWTQWFSPTKLAHILSMEPLAICFSPSMCPIPCTWNFFSSFPYSTYSSPTKASSISMTLVPSSHRSSITRNRFLLNTALPHCLKITRKPSLTITTCTSVYLSQSQISKRSGRPRPRVQVLFVAIFRAWWNPGVTGNEVITLDCDHNEDWNPVCLGHLCIPSA